MQDQDQNPDPTAITLPPQPKDSLRLEYRLIVTGADQTPVDIEGCTDLPMALREHSLYDAEETYGKAFQILLEQPARAAVRSLVNELIIALTKRQQPASSWLEQTRATETSNASPLDHARHTAYPGHAATAPQWMEGVEGAPPAGIPSKARQAV